MNFKFLKTATLALIMMTSSIVGVANATLITDLTERDWMVAGDKAITYDSSTGLEWLDLTMTLGNSILDTEAESFFGEFRWATYQEIENILDAGISGSGFRISNLAIDISNATTFVALFGAPPGQQYSTGVSRGSYFTGPGFGRGFVQFTQNSAYADDPESNCCTADFISSPYVGSWLVRTVDVPEPPALAIFTLGMIGLASRRFKKQS